MKFGHLLEFHKIPEWYTYYALYNDHKNRINQFKKGTKASLTRKLKGFYTINKKGQIYCIDFIKNYRDDIANNQKGQRHRLESFNRSVVEIPDEERPGIELADSKKRSASALIESSDASKMDPLAVFGADKKEAKALKGFDELEKKKEEPSRVAPPKGEDLALIEEVDEDEDD